MPLIEKQKKEVFTEVKVRLEEGLAKQPKEVVPYKILPAAIDAVKKVVSSRLKLFNEAGKPAFSS